MAVASASPGTSPAPGAGTLIGASGAPVDASTVASVVDPPIAGSSDSFLESLVVPGLLIGVPAIVIIGILIAQLAVGAAWLPVIRRWLHRRV